MRNTDDRCLRSCRTVFISLFFSIVLLVLSMTPVVRAQQDVEQNGINQDNYNIKQSIEFGGRITSVSGNLQTYNTMVNLQDGPRLLNFTTEMRSLDNRGTLFDRFYFSNFGYGGDPNVVSSIRISKNKWYAFDGMFRHDENFFDYSVMANPFNPPAPPANAPAGFNPVINAPTSVLNTQIVAMSPHYFNTRRNLQNYGLTLLPDAKVRFRLGYNHNTNSGPSYTTDHQGTDQFLFQNLSAGMDQYRVGVDFRFLPRTTISYDQIWSRYKTDPGSVDENQQFAVGSGFPPVDLGVNFNGPPCNPVFQPGGTASSNCNAYSSYSSHWRERIDAPTEQVSLQSNPIAALQLSGKYSYTSATMNTYDYTQAFSGFASKSLLSNSSDTGPIEGHQVSSYADLGASWQITHDFSLVDEFHYGNWQEPGQFTSTTCNFFSNNLVTIPNFFAPTATLPGACTAPANALPGMPTHNSKSDPDILMNLDSNFLKQQITNNLIEGQVLISPKAGGYFGYRFTHRVIADNFYNTESAIYFPGTAQRGNCTLANGVLPLGCAQNPDGSVSYQTPDAAFEPVSVTDINYNGAVFGLWLKPVPRLSINLDADIGSGNKTFTPLAPQNFQDFRARVRYRFSTKLNLLAYFLTQDGQNPAVEVSGTQHNRSAGFNLSLTPSEKFSAQLGYNYNYIHSDLLVCYTSDFAQPGLPACPGVSGLVQQASPYTSEVNTGFLDFLWTPVSKLSLEVGANLSGVTGSELNVNPLSPIALAPAGPLNSNWYQPYSVVSYRFAKQWSGRARWDYYDYHEDSNGSYLDIYVPRNFHANVITLSVRFAF